MNNLELYSEFIDIILKGLYISVSFYIYCCWL